MRITLGMPLRLSEIAYATGGVLNACDATITHISTDTRELFNKDLFVALKDGVNYEEDAKELGAYTLSVNSNADVQTDKADDALLKIASYYIKNLPYLLYNIGITGSVGKTTTKEFLKILLSERFRTHSNEGNFNNDIGLPLSVLQAPRDTQVLIMEMGMNHFGEIAKLSECFRPDIAIITNIGTSHIGNLGSRENIAKAKLEVLSGMEGGHLFVPYGEALLSHAPGKISVSIDSLDADYTLLQEEKYVSLFSHGKHIFSGEFKLTEKHYLKDLAFACSAAALLGLHSSELVDRMSLISRDNTRQKLVCKKNLSFLADCYNSSLESVFSLFDIAKSYDIKNAKSLLLGDILELGEHTERIHREVGASISNELFDNVFLFGKYADYIKEGAISSGFPALRIFVNLDTCKPEITADQIKANCKAGDVIFMKASRGVKLERILDYFD